MINYWTCDFVYCSYILLNVFWAKNNVFVCVCVSLNNHLNPVTTVTLEIQFLAKDMEMETFLLWKNTHLIC